IGCFLFFYIIDKEKINLLLAREPLTEKELLESFSTNRHPAILKTLAYMLDEGKVIKKEEKLCLP
ncbi:MAG: hypothetical protein ACE5FF_11470, partial [Saprospiraceae bacterium]